MKTYTVKELASLSGVTPRTLRYYDKIGLLVPGRSGSGDYRVYESRDVDRLQEILILRELEIELSEIAEILDGGLREREARLSAQLDRLKQKRAALNVLIKNVSNTIRSQKGGLTMEDNKKFEGLKRDMIDQNESEYGEEIREKWGDDTIDESNRKMMNLSKPEFEAMKKLGSEINSRLEDAVTRGRPSDGTDAIKIAKLHREWLGYTWPSYNPDAHMGLAEMYIADERFRKYYDSNVDGCAQFLRDAVVNMIVSEAVSKDEE